MGIFTFFRKRTRDSSMSEQPRQSEDHSAEEKQKRSGDFRYVPDDNRKVRPNILPKQLTIDLNANGQTIDGAVLKDYAAPKDYQQIKEFHAPPQQPVHIEKEAELNY